MNIKALITSLVLGSSSVALASPVSFGASAQVTASIGYSEPGPVIRDHRPAPPVRPIVQPVVRHPMPVRPVYQPLPVTDDCTNLRVGQDASVYIGPVAGWLGGWLTLTQPTRIEKGRETITVPATSRRFNTIQLRGVGGDTDVGNLLVQFRDGSYQMIRVNKTLCGTEAINLDIPGRNRAVWRIVVYGSSARGSRYTVSIA